MDNPVAAAEKQILHFAIPRDGIQVCDLITMVSDYPYDAVVSLSYAADQLSFKALGVVIDCDKRTITGPDGVFVPTEMVFDIVEFLAERADVVQSREEIAIGVWGRNFFKDFHTLDVHISKARAGMHKEAGISPETIRTVRGVGFMFQSQLISLDQPDH